MPISHTLHSEPNLFTAKVYIWGKFFHYFCFFIPIVVEVECMDLHHSHYGNRFSIA